MAASEVKKSIKSVSKTVKQITGHQILSDQHFRSYSDFKAYKVLKYKK